MKVREALCVITALMIVCAATAMAQSNGAFIDRGYKFRIALVEDWRATSYTDAVGRKRTEFIRGQRDEGLLRISKENLNGSTLPQVVDKELEDLRFYDGKYLLASREPFEGATRYGIRITFYYIEGGRQATGTTYFLKDANAVWILRFTGQTGSLDTGRAMTDQIARSFRPI